MKFYFSLLLALVAFSSSLKAARDTSLDVFADKLSYSESDANARLRVEKGADIATVWYRVVNDLGETEIGVTRAESDEIIVPLVTNGAYTVIAAGFESDDDLSNPLEYTECYFYYEPNDFESWVSMGMAQMTDDLVASIFYDLPNLTFKVEAQKNLRREGQIRLVNPYGKPFCDAMAAAGVPSTSYTCNFAENHYMYFDISDPDFVYMSECCTGLKLMGHDVLLVGSFGKFFLDMGRSKDEIRFANYEGSLADNTITFHQHGLYTMWNPDFEISSANSSEAFSVVLPDAAFVADKWEDYVAPKDFSTSVYNLQGVKVAELSSQDAVSSLPAGIYVINGKKIVIN